jgi:hypothetical protein
MSSPGIRLSTRSVIVMSAVAALAVACGSTSDSVFDTSGIQPGEAGATPGMFEPDGGMAPKDCVPQTCALAKANCGPIGDGCGGIVQCGTCGGDEVCGGGSVPSQCGKPKCTPKTCTELGANCGPVGDGCGGVVASCGTCNTAAGEICGGAGASRCGTGVPGTVDGGPACTPSTCASVGANCGPVADGCGGLLPTCGTCALPKSCGGGGTPSVCGGTACVPKTCASVGANCGPIADGCGGIVQCGTCTKAGEICGGGGTASVCGNNVVPVCTGLCTQQVKCAGGGATTISGTITTPAGNLPIYGALVYVPNAPVLPFTPGVSCDQCGAAASGSPLVSTTTGPDGTFLLPNVPVSDPAKVNDIPVVVQLGRWRKQFTIQTTACGNTLVPAAKTALPHNKAEGDIPLTAISTGKLDALECVLRKIGIDDAEFTDPSGTGRIRFYEDNGARTSLTTPAASQLYATQAAIDAYDQVIFACIGATHTKTVAQQQVVMNYANKGGRVFATHLSFVWLDNIAPWSSIGAWVPNMPEFTNVTADVDTSFAKGAAFAQWLSLNGALTQPLPAPQIQIQEARHDLDAPITAPAQKWLTTTAANAVDSTGVGRKTVQLATFNTEWGKPASLQCGRVIYSDFHVTANGQVSTQDMIFPAECSGPLTSQEKVLAFMLFDLASCVTTPAPPPPTCAAKTCTDQGLMCGLAGDGCGNSINCGPCPPGTTCGGGGVSSVCGAPACTKVACQAGQCGSLADGCGGTLMCPPCAPGKACGGGGPNLCGTATCNKLSCPPAAPGSVCGPVADGCGGVNTCACPPGSPCVNGVCGAPPCTPRTCADAGANCGQVANGCGALLDCGNCLAPQTCGGGGNANICGGGVH